MSTYIDEVVGEVESRQSSPEQEQSTNSERAEKAFPLDRHREMAIVIQQRESRLKAD